MENLLSPPEEQVYMYIWVSKDHIYFSHHFVCLHCEVNFIISVFLALAEQLLYGGEVLRAALRAQCTHVVQVRVSVFVSLFQDIYNNHSQISNYYPVDETGPTLQAFDKQSCDDMFTIYTVTPQWNTHNNFHETRPAFPCFDWDYVRTACNSPCDLVSRSRIRLKFLWSSMGRLSRPASKHTHEWAQRYRSINHGWHIHRGHWRPWTATIRNYVPFDPQQHNRFRPVSLWCAPRSSSFSLADHRYTARKRGLSLQQIWRAS